MVVEVDIRCFASAAIPPKDEPPLTVDPDRVIVCQLAPQLLKMIARRHAQVLIGRRVVDHLEFSEQAVLQIGWYFAGAHVLHEERPQPIVPETDDHSPKMG